MWQNIQVITSCTPSDVEESVWQQIIFFSLLIIKDSL